MMKIAYENELRNLQSWINNVNMGLASVGTVTTDLASANNTCYQINNCRRDCKGVSFLCERVKEYFYKSFQKFCIWYSYSK